MPQISVIIPVYNSEKYLHSCIDSVLAQTFTDIELLLINDGSTDKSGEICEEYLYKDSRVKVYHKENGGVSSTRNYGIDIASGDWICFVDSDDYVAADFLKSMIYISDADLIISSFEIVENKEKWDNFIEKRTYNKNEIKDFLDRYIHTATLCAPWGKLFKKSLLRTLKFNQNISFAEDTIFVLNYLCSVSKIQLIDNWGYHYRREGGLSQKKYSIEQWKIIIHEYSKVFKTIEKIFKYDGEKARIVENINFLRKGINSIRESSKPIKIKYNNLVDLLNDENILEILRYRNPELKGKRRCFFDFLALNKMYLVLFIYIKYYNGFIY